MRRYYSIDNNAQKLRHSCLSLAALRPQRSNILLDIPLPICYTLITIKERGKEMSIINSIAQLRKPFASGRDREAYYSRRYKVVIKKLKTHGDIDQTLAEVNMFKQMTKREKEVFPILDVVYYNEQPYIIMKKCKVLASVRGYKRGYYHQWDLITSTLGLNPANNKMIIRMINKYSIDDLHSDNLGIDKKKRLVILDGGL